jgi:1-acyl-sn-glycerol-3-phosphate acyltransferase
LPLSVGLKTSSASKTAPARSPGQPSVASLARGIAASTLLVLNTVFWATLLFGLALLKLILPVKPRWVDAALNSVATGWVSGNSVWMRLTQKTVWDVEGASGLRADAWYLVCCNHQSWVDILVLQRVLNRRVPPLKFFLKRQLIYVPIMGLAWWALDFPFMRRHTKAALRRRPELRSQDQETTRRACERFAKVPTAVMNFVEGTRFTSGKHKSQASPYRNLLKPRAGALASTLNIMGPQFASMLDVTILYPAGIPSFWSFLCGQVPKVVVKLAEREVPSEICSGDYENDSAFRASFARWLASVWEEKDRTMCSLLGSSSVLATESSQ